MSPDSDSGSDSDLDDPAGTTEPTETPDDVSTDQPSPIGLATAQDRAREAATALLDHDFEGVIEVSQAEDGWRTLVEVVERHAVPNTQDIIGRYEITLSETGETVGYELRERYQRGDAKEEL